VDEDHFEVEPPNPDRRCSVESVAAHTLYEKGDPTTIHLPEGTVDLDAANFEQVDDRQVRVSGSTFRPGDSHDVLIEGVKKAGYRTITPAGIRDRTSRGEEVGDRQLLARVTEVRPELHLFGHVHESAGVEERDTTRFVNAACDRKGKTPFVLEV